ncbi:hypothetical protein NMY22_g20015 [Coprinellus aureogranulatus]|nr:hypothetical protein NMY22_g20015 [Coprinellus aureogranulatus]
MSSERGSSSTHDACIRGFGFIAGFACIELSSFTFRLSLIDLVASIRFVVPDLLCFAFSFLFVCVPDHLLYLVSSFRSHRVRFRSSASHLFSHYTIPPTPLFYCYPPSRSQFTAAHYPSPSQRQKTYLAGRDTLHGCFPSSFLSLSLGFPYSLPHPNPARSGQDLRTQSGDKGTGLKEPTAKEWEIISWDSRSGALENRRTTPL